MKYPCKKLDYGIHRWLIWGILALAFLIVYFHRVAPTFIFDLLMVDFRVEEAAVLGGIAAMYFYVYVFMQIPSGLLADFWGPRRTITAGMLLAGAGSLLFGFAPTLFYLFLGRFMVGLGVSVVFVSILKAQATWFKPAEFSTVTGMTIFAGNLGALISTTPLASVIDQFGWRETFYFVGFLSILVAFICWGIVRDHPGNSSKSETTPLKGQEVTKMMVDVFKNPQTWVPFWILFGVYGTLIAFFGAWGAPYLMQVYDLSRHQAANLLLYISLGMMAGCFSGFVSDKMKRRKGPFIIFVLIYIASWMLLTLWGQANPPQSLLPVLLFMMGLGGASPVLALTCAKEVNHPSLAGVATGSANIGGFLGISILQPLMGYLLDRNWQGAVVEGVKVYPREAYFTVFLLCLVVLAATAWTVLLLKETHAVNVVE